MRADKDFLILAPLVGLGSLSVGFGGLSWTPVVFILTYAVLVFLTIFVRQKVGLIREDGMDTTGPLVDTLWGISVFSASVYAAVSIAGSGQRDWATLLVFMMITLFVHFILRSIEQQFYSPPDAIASL